MSKRSSRSTLDWRTVSIVICSLSKKLWYMRDDPAKKQLYYNLSAAKEAAAKTMEGLYSALRDAQGSL